MRGRNKYMISDYTADNEQEHYQKELVLWII